MTKAVVITKGVVKQELVTAKKARCTVRIVDAFAKRLEWILTQRGWSKRELSRRAGLEETHVATILKKVADSRSQTSMETVVKLAKASGVSLDWLATGEGYAWAAPSVGPSGIHERDRAVRAARELRLAEEAIIGVITEEGIFEPEKKSARWWFDRILARHTLVGPPEHHTPDYTPILKSRIRPAPTEPSPPTKRTGHK